MLRQYIHDSMYDKRKDLLSAVFFKPLLLVVSFAYGVLVRCNHLFYKTGILKSYKVPAKIISVGNITLGGTGKTPFAIMLAEHLSLKGQKAAVLIRGYGEDEWKMLEDKLKEKDIKVFVGKDRVKTARKAVKEGIDTLILDDGFQHRRLRRDLNIVLLDSAKPFGNGHLFPRGILREPLSGLRKADIIVLTKGDRLREEREAVRGRIKKIAPGKEIIEAFHEPSRLFGVWNAKARDLSFINGKKVCVFSAICDASYFRHTVERSGARVGPEFVFPDHYLYTERDLERIFKECKRKNASVVLTTEKDAVKLRKLKMPDDAPEVLALGIEIKITQGRDRLDARLHRLHMRCHCQGA